MDMNEDIVFLILLRLPVKTLLRFKAVCKSWRSLIESSTFICHHLHHHHHLYDDLNSWNIILLDTYENEFFLQSGNNFQFSHNLESTIKFEFESEEIGPQIIGSCHGILCLDLGYDCEKARIDKVYYSEICLWNPATRQFRFLPEPPVPISFGYNWFRCKYGFGFDVERNDYKVVRILIDNNNPINSLPPGSSVVNSRIDVYSLSTNSWRKVDADLYVNSIVSNLKVPFRDGIFCWLGNYEYRVNGEMILCNLVLSFDFTTEVFEIMPVPDVYYHDQDTCLLYLDYVKENIACIGCHSGSRDSQFEIWVLNQYGVNDSWTKLSTIKVEGKCFLLGISKNGKLLWERNNHPQQSTFYLSDLSTQELEILQVEQPSFNFDYVVYKESLVSIKSAIGGSAPKGSDSCEKYQPLA